MNIDKQAMAEALAKRADPRYEKEFFGYLRQMATYFANKFNISPEYREDYISESYVCATKAIDKYDPAKNQSPFSYFYKAYRTHFMYWMRYDAGKREKSYKTCSYDLVENTLESQEFDEYSLENDAYCADDALLEISMEECEDKRVMIGNDVYKCNDVITAIKEAKLLAKRKVDVNTVSDHLVQLCLEQIYDHKNAKMEKKERKAKEESLIYANTSDQGIMV